MKRHMEIPEAIRPKKAAGARYINSISADEPLRVLLIGNPLGSWVWWITGDDGKRRPMRAPADSPAPAKELEAKLVWFLEVLDLSDNLKKIWSVSQTGVKDAIIDLDADDDFDPDVCPIKITRTGAGMATEYRVMPGPRLTLSEEQKKEIEVPCYLPALLAPGEDPFDYDPIPM